MPPPPALSMLVSLRFRSVVFNSMDPSAALTKDETKDVVSSAVCMRWVAASVRSQFTPLKLDEAMTLSA
ncbi:hypothetical protein D9M69_634690 [compost metagenome]